MEAYRVAVVVRSAQDLAEGLRSAVGLAMEDRRVTIYLVNATLAEAGSRADLDDLLEMLDDMEGRVCSNLEENGRWSDLVRWMELTDMARNLPSFDLLVVF